VKATYTYLADGTKIKTINASGVGYDYIGSFKYNRSNSNITLESVSSAGGRIYKTSSGYEQNDYMPYGERHTNSTLTTSSNKFLFGGKESQLDFGIDYYDSFARLQTTNSIFTSIDPKIEINPYMTPYAYCSCNPINRIDPVGELDDKYEYDIQKKILSHISDIGGDKIQYVDFIQVDNWGNKKIIGSASVRGPEIYVGETKNGWAVAPVNLWENMPNNLSGYNGYTYDVDDLIMRYKIRNGSYDGFKSTLANMERQGWAEPLTKSNYWNTYGYNLGGMMLFRSYLDMMSVGTPTPNIISNVIKPYNIKFSKSTSSVSNGPNLKEFNKFRSLQPAGKYSGYKGRGSSTKIAWQEYLNTYGYE